MSEEIKVVITLKGDRGAIGVMAPDCDPVLVTLEGGLESALERVPGLVEEARQRWAESPRYPKCESPLPSQTPPPSTPARTPQRQAAPASPQPRMF